MSGVALLLFICLTGLNQRLSVSSTTLLLLLLLTPFLSAVRCLLSPSFTATIIVAALLSWRVVSLVLYRNPAGPANQHQPTDFRYFWTIIELTESATVSFLLPQILGMDCHHMSSLYAITSPSLRDRSANFCDKGDCPDL